MSTAIDIVRNHHAQEIEQQLTETTQSLARSIAELLRVTNFCRAGATQPPRTYDLDHNAPLSTEEASFVDSNLISKGHAFDSASLLSPFEDVAPQPTQTLPQSSLRPPSPSRAKSIPLSPISNPSRGPQSLDRISPAPVSLKHEAGATSKAVTATPTPPRSPTALADEDANADSSANNAPSEPASNESSGSHARKPSSSAISPDLRKPMTTLPGPGERTSKVLHLPPKEQQEQHVREVEKAQATQRQRERKEDEIGLAINVSNADIASSPGSTAGAYSTSTPKPPQHSPDTSPDADYSHEERERLRKASLDQVAKEAKEDAMDMTADAQLRREEEQASRTDVTDLTSTRDRQSLDAGFAKSQLDLQTPRPTTRTRRSDNLDIDMNDAPTTIPPMPPPSTGGRERRMTRVASGAMRQKSVSEILGETPKLSSTSGAVTRRESIGAFGSDGERSKHSMVVFSKGDQSVSPHRHSRLEPDGYIALKGAQDDPEKDYMRPLFLHQAYQPPRAQPLPDLVQAANKTLSTSNLFASIRESFDYRILRRIYQLQNANKWAFRQMAKFPDPEPPTTHMDHLMAEMKWMRTDFREEKKWKQAGARRLAVACATYVNSTEGVRTTMRIKARIPPRVQAQDSMEGVEDVPELDHAGSTDSGESLLDDEVLPFPVLNTVAPAALFNLEYDDVVFEMDESPASDGILQELPMYESKPLEPAPLGSSKSSLIPVSKYVTGKLVPKPAQILRKRSRYDYESEDEEPASRPTSSKRRVSEVSMFLSPARRSPKRREISPEANDVALFDPINRHIRDRLHANHAFRPPSEFAMPATSFFEWRQNSQWTWDEDQKLRLAVKKFSYNWSLIAMDLQMFSQPSLFVSAAERRTPWECFERWEQLEGLPNDMDKTSYFRTYRSRIQSANRNVEGRAQALQQQAQASGNTVTVRRRTETNPFRVQRRKDDRHMMMIGAITKLQRKRETHAHRQAESAKACMLRKQHNDQNQAKGQAIHTPQEFSRMKHEREVKMAERQEYYRQQLAQEAQRRLTAQRNGQAPGMPNGQGHPQQRTASNGSSGPSPQAQMTNGQMQQNGNVQRPSSQGMMQNGFPQGMPNGINMQMPNNQMPNGMNMQRSTAQQQQDMRMMMAQRQAMAMQAQGTQANNLAAAHLGQMQSPQMLAAIAAQRQTQQQVAGGANGQNGSANGGGSSSPGRALGQGQNGYPTQGGQSQQLSSGYQPALLFHQQQVMQQFPNFTPEQALKLANERLKGQMQRIQASAMSAASGSPSSVPGQQMTNQMMMAQNMNMMANASFGAQQGSPTQYAAQLQRSMQAQQAAQAARMSSGSPALGNAIPVGGPGSASRSATPQNPQQSQNAGGIQRPGSSSTSIPAGIDAAGGGSGSPRMV